MVMMTDRGLPRRIREGFRAEAFEEAAGLLERTAQDYDQMAAQEQSAYNSYGTKSYLNRTLYKARVDGYTEKAALLRGQAKHIRDLKK